MKKGFTLIELIATIIILGILIGIAIPVIDKTVKEAKKKSYMNSINYLIKSVKSACEEQLDEGEELTSYEINDGIISPSEMFKGKIFGDGYIDVDESCRVNLYLSTDEYYFYKDYEDLSVEIGLKEDDPFGETETYNLVYHLPNETIFDGIDDYIDTNVMLFDASKDFAIFISFTSQSTKNATNPPTILHSMWEAKKSGYWNGISIDLQHYNNLEIAAHTRKSGIIDYLSDIKNNRITMAIKHDTATDSFNYYIYNPDTDTVTKTNITSNVKSSKFNQNVLLGAYQNTSGVKGRWFTGTIHKCDIYFDIIPDAELQVKLKKYKN